MNEKPLFLLNEINPPAGLFEHVVAKIQAKQHSSRLWTMRISLAVGLASIISLVPVTASLIRSFATSNFGIYASLIFSDTAVALSHWKDIGLSLLDSVPADSIALTVGLLVVALWSARAAFRSMVTTGFIRHA
jgi:predicted anti-sigma-YlaC factor YlaD